MTSQKSAPKAVRVFLDLWHRLEIWVAITAFSAIAILLIYDVVVREAVIPILSGLGVNARGLIIYGSQKIGVYMLIAGAFAGIGIATWTGAQLVPKVGHHVLPDSWDDGANRVADLFTFLFLACAAYIATQFVWESYESGMRGSGGLRIEVWKAQVAIPMGIASAALRYLAFFLWPDTRPALAEDLE